MSVMADKGQPVQPWQYPMYGGYTPNSYQQYPSYEPQSFFNYYHGAMPFGPMNGQGQPMNHMMHNTMKQFTPGGQLQPFGQEGAKGDGESKELPPLPPGPPPANPLAQPSPPGGAAFYQGNQGPSPVRFNMNRQQRPTFNMQAAFNNSGASKKKRKKKNKFNNQLQQQLQQQGSQVFSPPLPPHQLIRPQPPLPQAVKAPPLPPGPPPVSPKPPPEEPKPQVEPKPKPALMMDPMMGGHDWPPDLHDYIKKCYTKCKNDIDKDRVHIILKGKIMRATNEGNLWIKDWANEPLPLLESEMASLSIQPVFKSSADSSPSQPKKRLSLTLTGRLGQKCNSRPSSRSRSRSPHKPRQRTLSHSRRRKERSGSSGSENDWTPPAPSAKKVKAKSLDHSFGKRGGKAKNKGKERSHFYSELGEVEPVNSELMEKRAARFSNGPSRRGKSVKSVSIVCNTSLSMYEDKDGDFDFGDCHVVGVCQDVEKPYLRLTTAPEATAVRPPEVLAQSLSRVKERWLKNQDYHYACEQLKSIRQDLTVQGIRDKLTVTVYETHARIALEKGDHAEFNQCQSQLKLLHDELSTDTRGEFTAYRILYFIFTKEYMDLNTVMISLTDADRSNECVRHALDVRTAWSLNNYHNLFCLYKSAPRMSSYLMDWFLPRERKQALKTIIKAYVSCYEPP